MLQAEADHRRHAIVEQVIADLKKGPLAHLPSGQFTANGAWLVLAAMAFNLTLAADALALRGHPARGGNPNRHGPGCSPPDHPRPPGRCRLPRLADTIPGPPYVHDAAAPAPRPGITAVHRRPGDTAPAVTATRPPRPAATTHDHPNDRANRHTPPPTQHPAAGEP